MGFWFWTEKDGIIVPELPENFISKSLGLEQRTTRLKEKLGIGCLGEALAMSLEEELRSSYAIEGEKLDSCRLRSSIARRMHLSSPEWTSPSQSRSLKEDRAVTAMLDFIEHQGPLTDEVLLKTHAMLGTGRGWGSYREDAEIIRSGEEIVYEAPAPEYVRPMMTSFFEWWNRNRLELPYPVGAALAHFYLVAIHPFEDGNGRMARMMTEKALVTSPKDTFRPYSISASILAGRNRYYSALDRADSPAGVLGFVSFILDAQENAVQHAEGRADRLHTLRFFNEEFRDEFNDAEREIIKTMHVGERREWTMFDATAEMQDGEAAMDAWDRLVRDGFIVNGTLDLEASAENLRNSYRHTP